MNQSNLNQILLEGVVDQITVNSTGNFEFDLESVRYQGEDKHCIYINIRTVDEIAVRCHRELKKGRSVRIIGRLGQEDADCFITADHVIFKPEMKKPEGRS